APTPETLATAAEHATSSDGCRGACTPTTEALYTAAATGNVRLGESAVAQGFPGRKNVPTRIELARCLGHPLPPGDTTGADSRTTRRSQVLSSPHYFKGLPSASLFWRGNKQEFFAQLCGR